MPLKIPTGFQSMPFTGVEFLTPILPIYGKWVDRHFYMGFRVLKGHCNSAAVCHGGMMMTFADMLIGVGGRLQLEEKDPGRLPTIHLSGDFLAAARLGDWVEGHSQVLRYSRNLLFGQCVVYADGKPALRANAIFRKPDIITDKIPLNRLVGPALMRKG